MTVAEVQRELAENKTKRRGEGGVILHETSASAFLAAGLDIEHSQYVTLSSGVIILTQYYREKLKGLIRSNGSTSTARQATGVSEQRSVLQARLRTWESLRLIYMPGLLQYWLDVQEDPRQEVQAEEVQLWLPSSLPASRRNGICHPGLLGMELKLRVAQLADSLNGIHHTLRVKARMVQFKNKNICGQRSGVRLRAIIDGVHNRCKADAARYRIAQEARMRLEGPGDWCHIYKELKNEDARSYQDPTRARPWGGRRGTEEDGTKVIDNVDDDAVVDIDLFPAQREVRNGTGQTRRELSWIWVTTPLSLDDNADPGDDILRSEWCRSRARANRATEEVKRLHEEMRRTLAFLEHQEMLWMRRTDSRPSHSTSLCEELAAYALKQASVQRRLSEHFTKCWKEPLGTYNANQILGDQDSGGHSSNTGIIDNSARNRDNDNDNDNDDESDSDSDNDGNDDDKGGNDDGNEL